LDNLIKNIANEKLLALLGAQGQVSELSLSTLTSMITHNDPGYNADHCGFFVTRSAVAKRDMAELGLALVVLSLEPVPPDHHRFDFEDLFSQCGGPQMFALAMVRVAQKTCTDATDLTDRNGRGLTKERKTFFNTTLQACQSIQEHGQDEAGEDSERWTTSVSELRARLLSEQQQEEEPEEKEPEVGTSPPKAATMNARFLT